MSLKLIILINTLIARINYLFFNIGEPHYIVLEWLIRAYLKNYLYFLIMYDHKKLSENLLQT